MKREGRQHGLVRTYEILSSPCNPRRPNNCKFINRTLVSPPTAGLFSKVQSKPTNHSKFTGKCTRPRCNDCHMHPFAKSKDKTKGSHKRRSNDVVANYRLVTWRVVDDGPSPPAAMNFEGFSATEILNHLASRDYVDEDGFGHDECELLLQLGSSCYGYYDENIRGGNLDGGVGYGTYSSGFEITETGDDPVDVDEDEKNEEEDINDDDGMSFCDVGYIVELIEGDEGWCFVDEM